MRGAVKPAVLEIVAELGEQLDAEIPLLLLGVFQLQEGGVDLGPGGDGFDQGDLLRAQHAENLLDFGGLHPWLKIIQQGVVDVLVGDEEARIGPPHLDDFLEVGPEEGKVVRLAGRHPGLLPEGGDTGKIVDPGRGHAVVLLELGAGDAQQAGVVGIGIKRLAASGASWSSSLPRRERSIARAPGGPG